jgi:hypothetical protein
MCYTQYFFGMRKTKTKRILRSRKERFFLPCSRCRRTVNIKQIQKGKRSFANIISFYVSSHLDHSLPSETKQKPILVLIHIF